MEDDLRPVGVYFSKIARMAYASPQSARTGTTAVKCRSSTSSRCIS